MKHIKKFNEGLFDNLFGSNNSVTKDIEEKVLDAANSLDNFGSFSKSTAFMKGAKWAIANLSEEEIALWKKELNK